MLPSRHPLAVVFALAGCAASEPADNSSTIAFICEGGHYFWVDYSPGQARITVSSGSYVLTERPSSIGRKFSSDTATFIHDQDRAALNGLPGGPFRRCEQLTEENAGGIPPLPEAVEIENLDDDFDVLISHPDQ